MCNSFYQQLLERVDAFVDEHVRATAAIASRPTPPARSDQTQSSSGALAHAYASATAQATNNKTQSNTAARQLRQDDDANTYMMIGGTALALTFAALGAIRYKDRLRDVVEGVVPAISKGLSDAKYALFEA